MTTHPTPPLLPEGLRDRMPPEAEAASHVTRAVLDTLKSHGYRRVAPPIAEFRETLSGNHGDAASRDLLRFTDPISRRTLAIRPDITRQVGRIATSRLAHTARPMRLSYAGQVAKLAATTLWPEREMLQLGAELIGSDSVAAVCEIVRLAAASLRAAGVDNLIVDLTLPDLVETLAISSLPLDGDKVADVRAALDAKDAGALVQHGAEAYLPLLAATGPFDEAIARLRALPMSAKLAERLDELETIAAVVGDAATVTLDPTERHGFAYQSRIGFSIFVVNEPVTIGRGGSYMIAHPDGTREPAVGFSLYPDPLISKGLGQPHVAPPVLFLPLGHDAAHADALRTQGWVTIAALSSEDDAQALGCSHRLIDGAPAAFLP